MTMKCRYCAATKDRAAPGVLGWVCWSCVIERSTVEAAATGDAVRCAQCHRKYRRERSSGRFCLDACRQVWHRRSKAYTNGDVKATEG